MTGIGVLKDLFSVLWTYITKKELLHMITANYRNLSCDSGSILDTSCQSSCPSGVLHADLQCVLLLVYAKGSKLESCSVSQLSRQSDMKDPMEC